MIVALARKLLVALWRMTTTGEIQKASFFALSEHKEKEDKELRKSTVEVLSITDQNPRWCHPRRHMVCKPPCRMGPPPRSFAADANNCIMVWISMIHRIQGCGAMIRASR